jgi:hypothetical protein
VTEKARRAELARLKAQLARLDAKDPGRRWRVQSDDRGGFDEIVVGGWLHVERMDHRAFFLAVGERRWHVYVGRTGKVTMNGLDVPSRRSSGKGDG